MQDYSQTELRRLFDLPASLLRSLAAEGYISQPADAGKTSYSFHDLLVLRMASALKAAKIASSKITIAIGKIRAALPPSSVSATMALAAAVRDSAAREEWASIAEQHGLSIAASSRKEKVAKRAATRQSHALLAEQHYSRGHALEDSDVAAARAAYVAALNANSAHLEARINLGRLLHVAGELKQAERVYRQAKTSSALLSFNLAILLEDLNREEEAIVGYREALAQDPLMHDAHFNLSRLHEKVQQPREALRHLLAYRRHITKHQE